PPFCPSTPRSSELGYVEQRGGIAPVPVVDVPDVADGEAVRWTRHDTHLVAGADVALLDDAQIRPGPAGAREALREQRVSYAHAELPARQARLAHLEEGRSNRPALADHRVEQMQTLHGEVLPETAGPDAPSELRLPPARVLECVGVHG